MSFKINWPRFSDEFIELAKEQLTAALNKGEKPAKIVDQIFVQDLNMGTKAPDLEILEIGDLAEERFRGIFKLTYGGDASVVLKTKVQANPLLEPKQRPVMNHAVGILAANRPLVVPMLLRISNLKLRGIVSLVVDKQRGVTLVFKNDPLEKVDVNSTFDNTPNIRRFLQKQIESQLRKLFHDDLPQLIHNLSLLQLGVKREDIPSLSKTSGTLHYAKRLDDFDDGGEAMQSTDNLPHHLKWRGNEAVDGYSSDFDTPNGYLLYRSLNQSFSSDQVESGLKSMFDVEPQRKSARAVFPDRVAWPGYRSISAMSGRSGSSTYLGPQTRSLPDTTYLPHQQQYPHNDAYLNHHYHLHPTSPAASLSRMRSGYGNTHSYGSHSEDEVISMRTSNSAPSKMITSARTPFGTFTPHGAPVAHPPPARTYHSSSSGASEVESDYLGSGSGSGSGQNSSQHPFYQIHGEYAPPPPAEPPAPPPPAAAITSGWSHPLFGDLIILHPTDNTLTAHLANLLTTNHTVSPLTRVPNHFKHRSSPPTPRAPSPAEEEPQENAYVGHRSHFLTTSTSKSSLSAAGSVVGSPSSSKPRKVRRIRLQVNGFGGSANGSTKPTQTASSYAPSADELSPTQSASGAAMSTVSDPTPGRTPMPGVVRSTSATTMRAGKPQFFNMTPSAPFGTTSTNEPTTPGLHVPLQRSSSTGVPQARYALMDSATGDSMALFRGMDPTLDWQRSGSSIESHSVAAAQSIAEAMRIAALNAREAAEAAEAAAAEAAAAAAHEAEALLAEQKRVGEAGVSDAVV